METANLYNARGTKKDAPIKTHIYRFTVRLNHFRSQRVPTAPNQLPIHRTPSSAVSA
jgi:hypothetical protein